MDELFRNKEDSDKIKKINLEELYDKKKTYDLSKLSIYNKILKFTISYLKMKNMNCIILHLLDVIINKRKNYYQID